MERKSVALGGFKALGSDSDPGTFEAIAAVFGNVDHGGDRIQRGAFKRTIAEWRSKGRSIPVLWSHDSEQVPIGVIKEAVENNEGLRVKAQLLVDDHPQARAVYAAMKAGALHEFSFGYEARDYSHIEEEGRKIRVLKDVGLMEVSPVFRGMNPSTRLMGVKSAAETDLGQQLAEIDEKILNLQIERKEMAEAIEALNELPEPPTKQEQDDTPKPTPSQEGQEAEARIRALTSAFPQHME
jgi:HK97 family phage prohead protease